MQSEPAIESRAASRGGRRSSKRDDASAEGPVFVDTSGRRSRLLRRMGLLLGVGCLVYAVVLGAAFMGWGTSLTPSSLLPFGDEVGIVTASCGSRIPPRWSWRPWRRSGSAAGTPSPTRRTSAPTTWTRTPSRRPSGRPASSCCCCGRRRASASTSPGSPASAGRTGSSPSSTRAP
nr:hypothetical protein [Streptomyces achromogenes]